MELALRSFADRRVAVFVGKGLRGRTVEHQKDDVANEGDERHKIVPPALADVVQAAHADGEVREDEGERRQIDENSTVPK